MDELSVVMKARDFITRCGPLALPIYVENYAAHIGGTVTAEILGQDEDAWSVRLPSGKLRICVNCAQNARRRRFSVCHEIAHDVLGIPADHSAPTWSYGRRPPGEIACDVFAAELLLPYKLFKPRVDATDMDFFGLSELADEFDASLVSTGSRFAAFSRGPCAFVVSENGKVRYASRSTSLRYARAWIRVGMKLSVHSYSARVRDGLAPTKPEESEANQWFEAWEPDGALYEDVRHLGKWDQTLTLLWCDSDDLVVPSRDRQPRQEETSGLRELDGVLPWPGRSKRRI